MSRAASIINQALSVPEVSIAPLLELTAYEVRVCGTAEREPRAGACSHRSLSRGGSGPGTPEHEPRAAVCSLQVFEQDLKRKGPEPVPLEFIPTQGLLGRRDDLCAQFFTLS